MFKGNKWNQRAESGFLGKFCFSGKFLFGQNKGKNGQNGPKLALVTFSEITSLVFLVEDNCYSKDLHIHIPSYSCC